MPELPEVEIYKRYFDSTSLNQPISGVKVHDDRILENTTSTELRRGLISNSFKSNARRGKYLFSNIDTGNWLMLHFGMTGNLKYFKDKRDEPDYSKVLIEFENGYHLSYICKRMLGKVGLVDNLEGFILDKNLGPDALDLNFEQFTKILNRGRGFVKTTLMNQNMIAGLGNVFVDEILHQASIHPKSDLGKLDEAKYKLLFQTMNQVLNTAIERNAKYNSFPDSYITPRRNKEGKCPRCKTPLERIKISGRTTYFCQKCQQLT